MIDWKKVASKRLKEIRQLKHQLGLGAEFSADVSIRTIKTQIHGRCLASMGHEKWREMWAYSREDIIKKLSK